MGRPLAVSRYWRVVSVHQCISLPEWFAVVVARTVCYVNTDILASGGLQRQIRP